MAENVLGLENASLLKMFGGGKSCSQECLLVENSLYPKMSLFGIYLMVENTSWWKMFGGPKKLQPLSESEEKHHLHRPQPIQLIPLTSCSKRHEKA